MNFEKKCQKIRCDRINPQILPILTGLSRGEWPKTKMVRLPPHFPSKNSRFGASHD
ncbi:hypothetical protein RSSM_02110 [Rhodopirellula sallentina SM41]|uniref:Uncharacterized protein n=1 Tax=Rhodopirellula sallentina SM41 TaxID=1263870 RepID=M5UF38_9BACT|nr:hypothetical protein RSSM_02110 [Rhodopirellula sallentina SM41]